MSTTQDKHVPSFNNLPIELLIKIWEIGIGSPRVLQVVTTLSASIDVTPALVRSTAAGRAAVSVSRKHRNLVLKHILPNTIVLCDDHLTPLNVVRYNAARDIISLNWTDPMMVYWDIMIQYSKAFNHHAHDTWLANTRWLHEVQKLAVELGFKISTNSGAFGRNSIYDCFSGLKELYIICPTIEVPDIDAVDAEEDNAQGSLPQWTPQDVSQEMTLESFMGMESTAPIPEPDNDAFLHTGTYTGVCEGDTYLSGRAALKWLGPRRNKTAVIQEVEKHNRDSEELRRAGLKADMKVGILLHVIEND